MGSSTERTPGGAARADGVARLSGLDTVFLAAERPGAALHTMAVLVLDPATIPGGYDFERFRTTIARSAATIRPLVRRLVAASLPWQRPIWQTVESLRIESHVFRATLPAPGDRALLAQFAAKIDEVPLDRRVPLWEMHVVDGLADGSIAIVCKLSHALMDGVAGMEFMGSFFSTEPDSSGESLDDADAGEGAPPTEPAAVGSDLGIVGLARDVAVDLASLPTRVARAFGELAIAAAHTARTVGQRGWQSIPGSSGIGAPRVPWNRALSSERSIAFAELDFDAVRDVARRRGVRVNDVLLAVVAAALRDRLLRDDALPDRPMVVAIPVSTHEAEPGAANALSVMLVPVATDIADPIERLALVHSATEHAKATHNAVGPQLLMTIADLIPPPLIGAGAAILVDAVGPERVPPICNFMLSNVAGPPLPLYLAGAHLRALFPIGPIFPGMGLNVTAVSCEHSVGFGLVTCPAVLSDLWSIADDLPKYLAELMTEREADIMAVDPEPTRPSRAS